MQEITIPLDDQSTERLKALAQQRGETVEETARAVLRANLPVIIPTTLAPDDPDGIRLIRSLAGSIAYWPGHEGQTTNTTNEEIDRLTAEEAMNPHADE